jgi:non-heme chloroperoxidase
MSKSNSSTITAKDGTEIYYPGAPHGLTATHQDQVNADLLAFLRS